MLTLSTTTSSEGIIYIATNRTNGMRYVARGKYKQYKKHTVTRRLIDAN